MDVTFECKKQSKPFQNQTSRLVNANSYQHTMTKAMSTKQNK